MKTRKILLSFFMSVFLLSFPSIGNGLCSFLDLEKQVYDAIIGDWEMETEFQGDLIPALMILSVKDGKLAGVWVSMDQEMEMIDLEFDGKKLSFKRTMGEGGDTIDFEGIVEGDEISGKYLSPMGGEYKCTGERKRSE
ncbi:MAG: hypothetical protein JRJ00_12270 [Deltaproteobacteria bacterium]|nr:hypothetical protein [Deltaproteobacteria bacterium]